MKRHVTQLGIIALLFCVVMIPAVAHISSNAIDVRPATVLAVDITGFNQVTLLGNTYYVDPATGALYDSQGNPTATNPNSGQVTNANTGAVITPAASTCTLSIMNPSASIQCMWSSFIALIGFVPAAIGVFLVTIAGILFNYLVDHTVIAFSTSIYGSVSTGVETAWTVFRDLSNIVIIGMFVFIAISIILGLKEFGEKRMVARVLIVAVLINFSLIFTKVVIDASSFTAYQFYKAASLPADNTTQVQISTQTQSAQPGISGSFLKTMGITGINDTYSAVAAVAQGKSWYVAILYGVLVGALLFAVAAVLLYGCFLLIVRAIILIFLLMTAALAFATNLIPGAAKSHYGWEAWWSNLVRSALLAPLLMLFLWATLKIANTLPPSGGTLGSLVSNPESQFGIAMLFNYLIILGLLFASIKVASSFSHRIGLYSVAATISGAPFTLASRFPIAATLRQTVGRRAQGRALDIDDEIKAERRKQADARRKGEIYDNKNLANLIRQKELAEKTAKRSFNFMNTGAGKALAKGLGLKGAATGADTGKKLPSFAEQAKARAEDAAKKAESAAYTRKEAAKDAENIHANDGKVAEDRLEKERQQNEEMVKAIKDTIHQQKESSGLNKERKDVEDHAQRMVAASNQKRAELDKQLENKEISREAHKQQMDSEANKISEASAALASQIKDIERREKVIEEPYKDALDLHAKKNREIDRELGKIRSDRNKAIKETTEKLLAASHENARAVATSFVSGIVDKALGNDELFSRMTRSKLNKSLKTNETKERIEAEHLLHEEVGGSAAAHAAPETPTGGAAPSH